MSDESVFPIERSVGFRGGLTKRDLFAAIAMQGILGHPDSRDLEPDSVLFPKYCASQAVRFADALIAELDGEFDR